MSKGLLILLGTFIVVAILHVVSMKMTKISEAKKIHYRKFFLVFLRNYFHAKRWNQSPRKRRIWMEFFNSIFSRFGDGNFKLSWED